MRYTNILDVLGAVQCVARKHHEVNAWWYAPVPRLGLTADPSQRREPRPVELAIVARDGAQVDEALLASELADLLGLPGVHVRPYRGIDEPRALFRLVTNTVHGASPERRAEMEEQS